MQSSVVSPIVPMEERETALPPQVREMSKRVKIILDATGLASHDALK